jgi:hypothetical protein
MKETRAIILKNRPTGTPELTDFEIKNIQLPELKENEVLVKILYLSVDPYMRGRMNDRPSYIPPFEIGAPISGGSVGEVVESKFSSLKKGDIVYGMLAWSDHVIAKGSELQKLDPHLAPVSTALGVLGMPGITAYFGLLDIGKPKQGETLVVSGAAGAVGSLVGQIGKIHGCRVVGIAGGKGKCDYLTNELGFDAAVNYKDSNFNELLEKACPNGVDIYFDNVGGVITDSVIKLINKHARISICGQISMYNSEKADIGPRSWWLLLTKTATAQGFMVMDYVERYPEGIKQMAEWLEVGRVKCRETIAEGLESAPKAFIGLFNGENVGKQIVKVS